MKQQESEERSSYSELEIRQSSELANNWLPEPELLQQISEYGIPDEFALSFVDDFKHLSLEKSERHHSWGVKFLRYVIKKWREQEVTTHKQNKRKPIPKDWIPDEEAYEILINAGVGSDFIEKEINLGTMDENIIASELGAIMNDIKDIRLISGQIVPKTHDMIENDLMQSLGMPNRNHLESTREKEMEEP